MARPEVKREYAAWLAMPRRLKVSLSIPVLKSDFAEAKGVSMRTLQRWDKEEEFAAVVAQERARLAAEGTNGAVAVREAVAEPRPHKDARAVAARSAPEPAGLSDDPVFEEGLSAEELQYARVKDTLVRMAEDGDRTAIDLYMKHYGRAFIEAERAADSGYVGMSDDEVFGLVLELVGAERAAEWLAGQLEAEVG